MPNSTQKEQPENPLDLTPRERATRFFRVAQRVKKKLLEIKKVNLDLSSIPERNAKRILNDEMVISVFKLSENMLKILSYVPVEKGPMGQTFVVCLSEEKPKKPSKDRNSQKFVVERRTPTEDVARHLSLEKHIQNLQKFARPLGVPLGPLAELPHLNSQVSQEGYELFKKWWPDPEERYEAENQESARITAAIQKLKE